MGFQTVSRHLLYGGSTSSQELYKLQFYPRSLGKLVGFNILLKNIYAAGETFGEFFATVKDYYTDYCSCSEVAKLFTFLLSPYRLIGTRNNTQNCSFFFLRPVDLGSRKVMYCVQRSQYHKARQTVP
jgi:hypothetical protein